MIFFYVGLFDTQILKNVKCVSVLYGKYENMKTLIN